MHPDRIALQSAGAVLSYGELSNAVSAYGKYMEKRGIAKGSKVLILHPACPELFAALLALLGKGVTVVFAEEWTKMDDIAECCRRLKCDYILCGLKGRILKMFHPELRRIADIGLLHSRPEALPPLLPADPDPESAAIISFSSGSSGPPKAVIRTHSILKAQFEALRAHIRSEETVRMCTNFPVVILLNLGMGSSSIISKQIRMSDLAKSRISGLYRELRSGSVTHLAFSPFLMRRLARYISDKGLPRLVLKQLITGGSPVFPAHISDFMRAFQAEHTSVLYGSSEAEPIAACTAEEVLQMGAHSGLYAGKADPCTDCITGDVPAGVFKPAEPDACGEIVVKGGHVVQNYLNSDEALRLNKITINGERWHRTGDYAMLDAEGHLFLCGDPAYAQAGRCLLDTEKLLQEIEGVEFASMWQGVVYVQVFERASKQQIAAAVKQHFPEAQSLRFVKMPLDRRHNGKIRYKLLFKP